jgi:hypothetical protein
VTNTGGKYIDINEFKPAVFRKNKTLAALYPPPLPILVFRINHAWEGYNTANVLILRDNVIKPPHTFLLKKVGIN